MYAGRVGQLLLREASCLSCLPKLGSDHGDKLDGVKASGDKTIVYKHLTALAEISGYLRTSLRHENEQISAPFARLGRRTLRQLVAYRTERTNGRSLSRRERHEGHRHQS